MSKKPHVSFGVSLCRYYEDFVFNQQTILFCLLNWGSVIVMHYLCFDRWKSCDVEEIGSSVCSLLL